MARYSTEGAKQKRRGVAAIEFAMVAPLFIMMMMGIVVYGSWFWLAHSVQALAAESARSAIGGLDASEREVLAKAVVTEQAPTMGLNPTLTSTKVVSSATDFKVNVTYDASTHPLMALAVMIPKPPAHIERTAVVRLGGY